MSVGVAVLTTLAALLMLQAPRPGAQLKIRGGPDLASLLATADEAAAFVILTAGWANATAVHMWLIRRRLRATLPRGSLLVSNEPDLFGAAIDVSAVALAARLERLARDRNAPIVLVAHSTGCLVHRRALEIWLPTGGQPQPRVLSIYLAPPFGGVALPGVPGPTGDELLPGTWKPQHTGALPGIEEVVFWGTYDLLVSSASAGSIPGVPMVEVPTDHAGLVYARCAWRVLREQIAGFLQQQINLTD